MVITDIKMPDVIIRSVWRIERAIGCDFDQCSNWSEGQKYDVYLIRDIIREFTKSCVIRNAKACIQPIKLDKSWTVQSLNDALNYIMSYLITDMKNTRMVVINHESQRIMVRVLPPLVRGC